VEQCCEEKQILLATSLAMQLAKGLTEEDIKILLNLINQVSCSLVNLLGCKRK